MAQHIGILTAGGDSPGLNAAIRGVGKAAQRAFGMNVIGFRDGFRGLMENRTVRLEGSALSGILTIGGTILGTSRDKPDRMPMGSEELDMTEVIVGNYHKHNLDALVCLGGGGTMKNAYHLMQHGLNILTLPKTIDNDVALDTALGIATEAVDRLHSTAHSHHRIILLEVMGHNAGWLALGAGLAGGADVILIPEIPYDVNRIAEAILLRSQGGKGFSIIVVSEGALSQDDAAHLEALDAARADAGKKKARQEIKAQINAYWAEHLGHTARLTRQLEELTRLESRVTILGHLQRGGTPSAADRLLATRLGTAAAELIDQGVYGVMVAARGEGAEPVPLDQVAGNRRTVPLDHPWVRSARLIGTSLGD